MIVAVGTAVWIIWILLLLVVAVVALGLYFVPTLIGMTRKVPNLKVVFLVNLLLGWTLIGWVLALVLALRAKNGAAST